MNTFISSASRRHYAAAPSVRGRDFDATPARRVKDLWLKRRVRAKRCREKILPYPSVGIMDCVCPRARPIRKNSSRPRSLETNLALRGRRRARRGSLRRVSAFAGIPRPGTPGGALPGLLRPAGAGLGLPAGLVAAQALHPLQHALPEQLL